MKKKHNMNAAVEPMYFEENRMTSQVSHRPLTVDPSAMMSSESHKATTCACVENMMTSSAHQHDHTAMQKIS